MNTKLDISIPGFETTQLRANEIADQVGADPAVIDAIIQRESSSNTRPVNATIIFSDVAEISDKIAESLGVTVGLLGNYWKNPSDAGSFWAQSERYRRFYGKLTRRLQRINCMPFSEFKFMVRMLNTKHKLRANRKKSKNRTVRGYWAKA